MNTHRLPTLAPWISPDAAFMDNVTGCTLRNSAASCRVNVFIYPYPSKDSSSQAALVFLLIAAY